MKRTPHEQDGDGSPFGRLFHVGVCSEASDRMVQTVTVNRSCDREPPCVLGEGKAPRSQEHGAPACTRLSAWPWEQHPARAGELQSARQGLCSPGQSCAKLRRAACRW